MTSLKMYAPKSLSHNLIINIALKYPLNTTLQCQILRQKLYETGLVLVDPESQSRIKRFYHKRDSYRKIK